MGKPKLGRQLARIHIEGVKDVLRLAGHGAMLQEPQPTCQVLTLRKMQCSIEHELTNRETAVTFPELQRESLMPTSAEQWLSWRAQDITSTEVSALFGLSPYLTAFELWHQKKNAEVVTLPPNERMTWGSRLQDAIARGIIDDSGSYIGRQMIEYMRLPHQRIGASFDWRLSNSENDDDDTLLEVKNVDGLAFRDGWTETEFGVEAPAHIELQVQHQMLVSGLRHAIIGALVGGNRVVLLRRDFDADVGRGILAACAEFWQSIDENRPPAPDFSRDIDAIKRIYDYAEPGKLHAGDAHVDELLASYHAAGRSEAAAKLAKDTARAELLTIIGDAERVESSGFKASCGVVGATRIEAYDRPAYRNFRVTPRKQA